MAVERIDVCWTEVDNAPGALYQVLVKAADAGLDFQSMLAYETGSGKGRAYAVAKPGVDTAGVPTVPALRITGADQLGSCAAALKPLADAGVNLICAGAVAGADGNMLLIVVPSDINAALKALG